MARKVGRWLLRNEPEIQLALMLCMIVGVAVAGMLHGVG
jgi:hypothetical protein